MLMPKKQKLKYCKKCKVSCCVRFRDICLFPEEAKLLQNKYGIYTGNQIKGINFFGTKNCRNKKKICPFGKEKPFECKIYPYALTLEGKYIAIYKDKICPLKMSYSTLKLIKLSNRIIKGKEKWFQNYAGLMENDAFSGKFDRTLIVKFYAY